MPPQVGMWAIVDGMDGPATVIVGAIGDNGYAHEVGLQAVQPIIRLVSDVEIQQARTARQAEQHSWLDHCRHIAGLSEAPPPGPFPSGYDRPTAPQRTLAADRAQQRGSVWWRAYKLAGELGYPSADQQAFRGIAQDFYRMRDRAEKLAQSARLEEVLSRVDIDRAVDDVISGRRHDEPFHFLGLPISDWLKHAESLSRGEHHDVDRALALTYALITLAEQEARQTRREPAPAYTERAAIIHRKRKDYNAEIAVIERWERACPPERRGPGAKQAKLLQRLTRSRELAAIAKAKGD